MKTIKVLVFALMAISFSACNDDLLDIKFGLNAQDVSYTIAPTTQAGEIVLDTTVQTINLDSVISANGADPGKVKAVKIKKITAFLDAPAGGNFDILESGTLVMDAPGLAQVTIAQFSAVPDGVNQFDITPDTNVNLLDYAKKNILHISGRLLTNGPVTQATTVRLSIQYEVTANPVN